MIELYINGEACDLAPDIKITLNFKSNAFGDVTKIVASNSQTVQLPKTPRNAAILGMPGAIAGAGGGARAKMQGSLYVHGVKVVDVLYVILLGVTNTAYEIAFYWGAASNLATLKDSDKTLRDIEEVLSITYGGDAWWGTEWNKQIGTIAGTGEASTNILNASYDTGIPNLANDTEARALVAPHPSVSARWVWDSVIKDNALAVEAPNAVLDRLSNMVVPFVSHDVRTNKSVAVVPTKYTSSIASSGDGGTDYTHTGLITLHSASTISEGIYAIEEAEVKMKVAQDVSKKMPVTMYRAVNAHEVRFNISIAGIVNDATVYSTMNGELRVSVCHQNDSGKWEIVETFASPRRYMRGSRRAFSFSLDNSVQLDDGDALIVYLYVTMRGNPTKDSPIERLTRLDIKVTQQVEDGVEQVFGGQITTRDNLPPIKQLDYIKAISTMFGLWATLVGDTVHLLSYEDLYSAEPIDWSSRLIASVDGDAQSTCFTTESYSQHNILAYADDQLNKNREDVAYSSKGTLYVDDDTLDAEGDFATLPFTATQDNKILHYAWDQDHEKIDQEETEARILVVSKDATGATMTATLLSAPRLINAYYEAWQRVMRAPVEIDVQMMLTEIDVAHIDFRRPVYLSQFGQLFCLKHVQYTADEASKVTLIRLPSAAPAIAPYRVIIHYAQDYDLGGYPSIEDNLSFEVEGAGDYFHEAAVLRFVRSAADDNAFDGWYTMNGILISNANPFVYDGVDGDLELICYAPPSLTIG